MALSPDNTDPALETQLAALKSQLGPDQFKAAHEAQDLYPCPSNIRTGIVGVVFPETIEQVQKITKWANTADIALYPLSTGNNWGYGGGHPAVAHSLIVDMGRMNRILSFDPELGLIELEPGVTQIQLYEYLKANKADFYVPTTGSSPKCSLISNALERGYGITPITDHFSSILSLRSVLPDGTLYQGPPGDQALKGPAEADPYLNGLFSQSNFGIVTSASMVLSPRHRSRTILMFGTKDVHKMQEIVDLTRDLFIQNAGVITSVKFFNLAYSVALNAEFPKDAYKEPDFDSDVWITQEGERQNLPIWLGVLFLSGPPDLVKHLLNKCKASLKPHVSQMVAFNKYNVAVLRQAQRLLRLIPPTRALADKIDSIVSLYDLMNGIPQTRFLKTAYWRAGQPTSLSSTNPNPGRDGAGLLWFAPIISFRGDDLLRYNEIIRTVCRKYKIIPVVSITTLSSRSLSSLVPILFDPATETERAHACYRELFEVCKAAGYLPYRAHVNNLTLFTDPKTSTYWHTVQNLKKEVDPAYIMAPGRYDGISGAAYNQIMRK